MSVGLVTYFIKGVGKLSERLILIIIKLKDINPLKEGISSFSLN